jgi:serine/threonine-protein kinase RsbT
MPEPASETWELGVEEDVVRVRQAVRRMAQALGFSIVDQTKIVTAASEIARNTVIYGGGGTCFAEVVTSDGRRGLRLTFRDDGPGIPDVAKAMSDGWTSGSGMGLGLPGAKRLVNDFEIESAPGKGTRVSIVRWK